MTTLPDWIEIDGAAGDLAQLLPELETLRDLARNWREIALRIRALGADAPVDSPVRLALHVANNIDDEGIIAIFHELGLENLHARIGRAAARLVDPAAPWAKLLQPCSAFNESYQDTAVDGLDDGSNPGLVQLVIPPLAVDGERSVGRGTLSFALGAQAGLECEAGAVWPFRADAVEGKLLRIGGKGEVSAKAGFSLPFGQVGSGHADIAASASAMLSWFFRPGQPEMPFAEALIPALTGIPSPLDLSDINHAAELARLEGLVLVCEGATSAGLGVAVGRSFSIPELASLEAGLVAELSFRRNARWLLSLRRTPQGLGFVLSRDQARERSWSAGLDLTVDYAPLAKRVHDILIEAEGLAQPVLARIRPFLSPGSYLSGQAAEFLDVTVRSITENEKIRVALAADLGLVLGQGEATGLATARILRQHIAELAATQAGGILADVDEWATTIARGLAIRLPALADAGLIEALAARVKPMLHNASTAFDRLVGQIAGDEDSGKALAAELGEVGITVSEAGERADALLAGVRDLVSKVEKFAQTLIEKTGEGVEHRLQARFGWSGTDSGKTHYELRGTIGEVNDETVALWRSLVIGRLEPFQRMLADPALAPRGFSLDPGSSLSRFAGRQRGFSLDVVVLGINVSIRSIVEGKATITTSANGDVTVSAEGRAIRDVDGFEEGRGATFISSWDLALFRAGGSRRAMNVSLAFDHDDRNLKASEVTAFLSGLSRQGLVEASRVRAAETVYQDWRTKVLPGQKVAGRIEVRMALPPSAVERMVALGREAAQPGHKVPLALFTLAAKALVACGAAQEERLERDLRDAQHDFHGIESPSDPWRVMYALRDQRLDQSGSSIDRGGRYTAFRQLIPRASGFPKLLATMAAIHDAIPAGPGENGAGWDQNDYARAEKDLAAHARKWLRLNQDFVFWFDAELHPVMLAFLRLLADFSRPAATADDAIAGLGAPLSAAETSPLFVITMAQAGGTPQAI